MLKLTKPIQHINVSINHAKQSASIIIRAWWGFTKALICSIGTCESEGLDDTQCIQTVGAGGYKCYYMMTLLSNLIYSKQSVGCEGCTVSMLHVRDAMDG